MSKPFVLIVEDDNQIAEIFSFALGTAKFETEIASDGKIAINRLEEIVPDVVVLDINLPHVSGREILQYIRMNSRFDKTKVILATSDSIMAETLEDQADLVLLKPIRPTQLREFAARLTF